VLGSVIFGLPSDRQETFAATARAAQQAEIAFAQFVALTPFPGTVDFMRWEKQDGSLPGRDRRRSHHSTMTDRCSSIAIRALGALACKAMSAPLCWPADATPADPRVLNGFTGISCRSGGWNEFPPR
jgi:hypothetical protein